MRTVLSLVTFVVILIALVPGFSSQAVSNQMGHVEWVANALKEMQSIKVGMTRRELLQVFTTEGGISTPARSHYVYKGCPYFKVQVEFQLQGGSGRQEASPEDKIIKISKPYIENMIID